jgi:hypothetical protein
MVARREEAPNPAVPEGSRDHPRSKRRSKHNCYEPGNRYEPGGGRIRRIASALLVAPRRRPGASPEFRPNPYRSFPSHLFPADAPGNTDAPACRKKRSGVVRDAR